MQIDILNGPRGPTMSAAQTSTMEIEMRKIIVITQLSLDGVMQAPGGPEEDPRENFPHGGWAMPFGDEAITRALNETVSADHDLLLGRRTYDIFAEYWPKQGDNPVTEGFDRAVKYVVTHRPDDLNWKTSKAIGGDVVEAVRDLKASEGRELHVWGSHEVLQPMLGAGLIDECRLWIAPVVLGQGKRLFERGVPATGLELVEARQSSTGVMLNTYRPAGPVRV
jgi:dihydrofolate reductase